VALLCDVNDKLQFLPASCRLGDQLRFGASASNEIRSDSASRGSSLTPPFGRTFKSYFLRCCGQRLPDQPTESPTPNTPRSSGTAFRGFTRWLDKLFTKVWGVPHPLIRLANRSAYNAPTSTIFAGGFRRQWRVLVPVVLSARERDE